MPNMYVRDVPRDLHQRLRKLKEYLDCKTWVTFFYEVDRIVADYIERQKGIPVRGE